MIYYNHVMIINIINIYVFNIVLWFLIFIFIFFIELVSQFTIIFSSKGRYIIVLSKFYFLLYFFIWVRFFFILNNATFLILFLYFSFSNSLLNGIFLTYNIIFQSLHCFYCLLFLLHDDLIVFNKFWIEKNLICLIVMKQL